MGIKHTTGRTGLIAGLALGLSAGCVSVGVTEPVKQTRLPYAAYVPPKREPSVRPSVQPRVPIARRVRAADATSPSHRDHAQAWMPSGGRISRRWTTIVIHHSATASGGARPFDKYHRAKGWDGLGYHFVIGNGTDTPDGFVEIGSRWHRQLHGAHCKTRSNYYNQHGIGICLVGDFTKTHPSAKQLASLADLVRFLTDRCGIPFSRVTTHGAITGKTECPGTYFRLADLRKAISTPRMASSIR